MSATIKTLELSNSSLRQQIARGASTQFQRGQLESLQDKCKAAEVAKHKAQDQLRHAGPYSSSFKPQLQPKPRPKSQNQNRVQGQNQISSRGRGPGDGRHLVSTYTQPIPILKLETPKGTVQQILTFVMDNISYIFEHLPSFIESLIGIYRSFSTCSSKSNSKATTSTSISTLTEGGKDKGVKNESKADGEQAEQLTQLMAEKGSYKKALREKEEELLKLKDKFEDQREQNRAYIEQFKAQERESQRYKSKKREKAYLKAIPILPPTPAQIISTPTQPPTQARPEVLAPTPQQPAPNERERDFQLFSAGSSTTDFTEDLQALADLAGRPLIDRKAERRDMLAKESERDQSRLKFSLDFDDHHSTNLPSPKMKVSPGGLMEDLEKQIRGMTTKKPDPYGDIDKAFSSFDNPENDPPRRSMAVTVEDEPDHESPVKANSTARTSPVSANEFMYGPDFA